MSLSDSFDVDIEEINERQLYQELVSGRRREVQIPGRGRIFVKGISKIVVEKVSQDEIYMLREDLSRDRQICGYAKKGSGDPCMNLPGRYTDHPGFGYCKYHSKWDTRKTILSRFVKKKKISGDLLNYYCAAEKLSKEEMMDLTPQLRLLYSVQKKFIDDRNGRPWDGDSQDMFLEIVKEIRKTVETMHKMERGIFLTPKLLESFFLQIVAIAESIYGKEKSVALKTALVRNIMFPEVTLNISDRDFIGKDKDIERVYAVEKTMESLPAVIKRETKVKKGES